MVENAAPPIADDRRFTLIAVVGASVALVLIAGLVAVGIVVIGNPAAHQTVEVIRDMFIILVALQVLVIGVSIAVLLIQIARLVNLLQNEVRPILTSTQDTVNTVRGTAVFLSQNVTEPVVQMGGTMAGIRRLFQEIGTLGDLARSDGRQEKREGPKPKAESGKSGTTDKEPDKQGRKVQKEGE